MCFVEFLRYYSLAKSNYNLDKKSRKVPSMLQYANLVHVAFQRFNEDAQLNTDPFRQRTIRSRSCVERAK